MPRLLSVVVLSTAATVLAAAGHVVAGAAMGQEHPLSLGGVLLAWLIASSAASALMRLRHSAAGVAAILGLGQLAFHGIFAVSGHAAGRVHAHSPGAGHHGELIAPQAGPPVDSTPLDSLAHPAMLLLHAAAWMLSVGLVLAGLHRSDAVVRTLALRASALPAWIAETVLAGALAVSHAYSLVRRRLDAAAGPSPSGSREPLSLRPGLCNVAAWGLRGPPAA
ncbi:hypothetical protein [Arthrobacter sp. UM1]|uniref:hypothetical protein n=1 Tax=Arthrobacter sp. UM1 TaxID=2766776 RepID=UPI001CF624CB|nr:hypothetical protein [Arthrobacter sp. UM1]MCB4208498.1 hypothetical protein [Arthrobacter sp. UM1]